MLRSESWLLTRDPRLLESCDIGCMKVWPGWHLLEITDR